MSDPKGNRNDYATLVSHKYCLATCQGQACSRDLLARISALGPKIYVLCPWAPGAAGIGHFVVSGMPSQICQTDRGNAALAESLVPLMVGASRHATHRHARPPRFT
jgi:hypothetical protein